MAYQESTLKIGDELTLKIDTHVLVDPAKWAYEYGLEDDLKAVKADAKGYWQEFIDEAVKAQIKRLGVYS